MLKTLLKLQGDATVIKAEAGNVENWRWHHLVEEVTGTIDECESDFLIKFRNGDQISEKYEFQQFTKTFGSNEECIKVTIMGKREEILTNDYSELYLPKGNGFIESLVDFYIDHTLRLHNY